MKNLAMGMRNFMYKLKSGEIVLPVDGQFSNNEAPLHLKWEGVVIPAEYVEETGEVRIVDQGAPGDGDE